MEKLSASDIKSKGFKKSALGFSPKEVLEFLELIAKSWEKMQRTERELTEKLKSQSEELTRWKNREHGISKLKEKAIQEAQQMRDSAQEEGRRILVEVEQRASDIRSKTEAWLETVIQEVEETQRQKISFMTAFKAALDSHYALLSHDNEEEAPLAAKLSQFLKEGNQVPGRMN